VNASWSPFGSQEVRRTPEIKRIAALPRRVWTDEAAADLAAMLTRELKTPRGTMHLKHIQAIALYEAMECGGVFGPIIVGGGKSLLCALLPLVLEAKRPVLLMPASLVSKTWSEREILKEHWRLPTNVQIVSYESLSLVASARKLEYIQPDLIVCDELHYLKARKAGRTRRVVRYMHSYPDTKFAGVSGTIMRSSILDFAHLLRFALKKGAPIPATEDEIVTWADCLDEKVNPLARRRPHAIFDLGERPSGVDEITAARIVFQNRLLETPGVVASAKTDGVTCSIRVQALEYQLSPVVEEHFKSLRSRWETPCGKGFSQATEFRMYARELALGFSYTWIPKEKVSEWDALLRRSKLPPEMRPASVGAERTQKSAEPAARLGTTEIDRRNSKEPRLGTTATGEKSTSNNNTASLLPSIMRLLQNTKGAVTSANEKRQKSQNAISPSTTVTRQIKSEGCFARSATGALDCSGMIPLGLSGPLLTFLNQNRPPPEWLGARREWCSFVREQISRSKKYDTMLQIANACRAGLLASETLDAWKKIESSYEPATRPIFYETTALETCLTWLQKNVGIVWVEHLAFGETLSRLSGAPYFGPGGLDASGASIKDATGKHSVIASITACGQGFNLQMFSKNLITSCPSGAATIEQVLGRTHRDGQLADEVVVDILLGCREQYEAFDRALEGAKAAEALLGHSQKLLLADLLIPDISKRKGPLWA